MTVEATTTYRPETIAALDVLMDTDAYKLDHRRQYPAATEYVYSNLTARGSRIPGVSWTAFFGLQAYLRDLNQRWSAFFAADVDEVCRAYVDRVTQVLGPNDVGAAHIRELHAYGRLPLRVRALPEGTIVPVGVPYLTVENTAPEFFWLTNYIETEMSAALWQPITSATTAWRNRTLLDARARATGADPAAVDWQGHDFSFRGWPAAQPRPRRGRAPAGVHRHRLPARAGLDRPELPGLGRHHRRQCAGHRAQRHVCGHPGRRNRHLRPAAGPVSDRHRVDRE